MFLPTTVAVVSTLIMCYIVFEVFPTRGNAMQATFIPISDADLPSPSHQSEDGGGVGVEMRGSSAWSSPMPVGDGGGSVDGGIIEAQDPADGHHHQRSSLTSYHTMAIKVGSLVMMQVTILPPPPRPHQDIAASAGTCLLDSASTPGSLQLHRCAAVGHHLSVSWILFLPGYVADPS